MAGGRSRVILRHTGRICAPKAPRVFHTQLKYGIEGAQGACMLLSSLKSICWWLAAGHHKAIGLPGWAGFAVAPSNASNNSRSGNSPCRTRPAGHRHISIVYAVAAGAAAALASVAQAGPAAAAVSLPGFAPRAAAGCGAASPLVCCTTAHHSTAHSHPHPGSRPPLAAVRCPAAPGSLQPPAETPPLQDKISVLSTML